MNCSFTFLLQYDMYINLCFISPNYLFCQFELNERKSSFDRHQHLCKILILLNCSITFVLKNVLQFAHQFVHHFYMLSIVWKNFNTYLIAQTSLGKPAYKGTLRILIFSWCICTLSQLKDPCLSKLQWETQFCKKIHSPILWKNFTYRTMTNN